MKEAWGHTSQEAIQAIRDAAEIYIEDMIEAGEKLKTQKETMAFNWKEYLSLAYFLEGLSEADSLSGEEVIPSFAISVSDLFRY